MTTTDAELYYDPYDFEIDSDPYPIWRRIREEKPLYYNERYDFYALSRFDDVEKAWVDWRNYRSGKGTVLELIKSGMEIPPGSIIFEDPPGHTAHRGLLSRVFTPKKMAAIEPQVRDYCAKCLDPHVGSDGFDLIKELGSPVPMKTIGLLLGIPEADQQAIRDQIDEGLRLDEGTMPDLEARLTEAAGQASAFAEYIDWRADNPSDDLMTALLQAEYEDVDGERKRLSREEVLNYVNLLAAAGNETTTKLIGWAGKVLGEHPDQRRELASDPDLIRNAIEELLRYEAPSPVNARFVLEDAEWYGEKLPAGSSLVLLNGSANRDERKFPDPDRFDIHRRIDHHLSFGYGIHFCLGASLARMEARVALEELLRRFPDWNADLANAQQARTSTVRGWDKLPVVLS